MLPEFIFSVGSSMQDLSCEDLNFINGSENTTSVNAKIESSIGISTAISPNAISNHGNNQLTKSLLTNDDTPKFDVSLLREIKLEDSEDRGSCSSFFTSNKLERHQQITESRIKSEENNIEQWTATHSIFNNSNGTSATTTTTNNQRHQHQHQPHQKHSFSDDHHTISTSYQHQNQHHQLLLQGSDDPLISYGANSVVNDDDHSVELKHLLTAASSNGQQQAQQLQQQQQQRKERHYPQPQLQPQLTAPTTSKPVVIFPTQHQQQQQQTLQKRPKNGCSSLTKQQLKVKAGLMSAANQQQKQRREVLNASSSTNISASASAPQIFVPTTKSKSKKKTQASNSTTNSTNNNNGGSSIKLRFHHQALPPEYLSHYEATQRRLSQDAPPFLSSRCGVASSTTTTTTTTSNSTTNFTVKAAQTAKLPPPKSSHENVRSWLQKIAEIQRAAQQQQQQQQLQHQQTKQQLPTLKNTNATQTLNNAAFTENIRISQNNNIHHSHQHSHQPTQSNLNDISAPQTKKSASPTNSLVKHTTIPNPSLASSSSKRVINYADLPYMGEITLNNTKPRRGRKPKKADICHLIYKNYGKTIFAGSTTQQQTQNVAASNKHNGQNLKSDQLLLLDDQPLNLCLKDYQKTLDLCSISSGEHEHDGIDRSDNDDDDHDAVGSTSDESQRNFNLTTTVTPADALTDTMLAINMKTSMSSFERSHKNKVDEVADQTIVEPLLHPVKAYYQKLLESGMLLKQVECGNGNGGSLQTTFAGLPIETIEKDNQIALKIPIPSGFFLTPKQEPKSAATSCSTPIPQNEYHQTTLQEPEPISTPSSIKSEHSFTTTTNSSTTGCCNSGSGGGGGGGSGAPQKRKRSAIFIPPMPAENATSPANEVSICKFKFTGGAKPTLQEKKMLSVDSDGNYRYYSGTGDKSTRGYEFFPRESLQQTGGFLPGVNIVMGGEKVSINDIPLPSANLSNELLQIPDSPTNTLLPIPKNGGQSAAIVVDATTATANANLQLYPSAKPPNIYGPPPHNQKNASSTTATTTKQRSSPYETSMHKATQTITTINSNVNINTSSSSSLHQRHKKRSHSSKRSCSQRENLEKTFKEKGFLIQTQQLESAEGATYCKFRQLKKFTRYLFRNWKDYLPDGKEAPIPHQIDGINATTTAVGHQQAAFENFHMENFLNEAAQNEAETATTATNVELKLETNERAKKIVQGN